MKEKKLTLTESQIRTLKQYKTKRKLRSQRNLNLLRLISSILFVISFTRNTIVNFYENEMTFTYMFGFLTLVYFIFSLVHFYNLSRLNNILRKFKKYKNKNDELLPFICNEKLKKCKELIKNKENKLAVEYYYNDFLNFLCQTDIQKFYFEKSIKTIEDYLYSD